MSTLTTSRNQTLELFKLIAAFFVVVIHVPFPGEFGNLMSCLSRFAVPLFFAVSGYFSFGAGSGKVAKRLGHILWLNLLATGLSLLRKYCQLSYWDAGVLVKLKELLPTVEDLAQWVFFHVNPFSGELWYLTAIAVCYGVLWVYVRFFGEGTVDYRPLYGAAAVLFLIRFAVDLLRLGGVVPEPYYLFRDGFFLGLPMFTLGIFLRQYQDRIVEAFRLTSQKLALLLLLGVGLSLLQWNGLGAAELPLGAVLQVAVLLLFAAANPGQSGASRKESTLSRLGACTTGIYILHYPIYQDYVNAFQPQVQTLLGTKEPWLRPVLIFCTALLTTLLLNGALRLVKRKKQ